MNRRRARSTVISRFSQAQRLGRQEQQVEGDWYPVLNPKTYAYLNAGFSTEGVLYPRYRAGAELFRALPGAFETSAGYRRLAFGAGVDIYTMSLSKYVGNWLISARGFLNRDEFTLAHSTQLSVRRYLRRGNDHWGLRTGWGTMSPEVRNVTDIGVLRSRLVAGELNRGISRHWRVTLRAGVSFEDRLRRTGLVHYTLDGGLCYRF
jgi:YaiO family outer membrane protein